LDYVILSLTGRTPYNPDTTQKKILYSAISETRLKTTPRYTAARDEDLSSVDETPSSAGIAGIRQQHNQLLFWLVLETSHFG
jgi:hypothetical protein